MWHPTDNPHPVFRPVDWRHEVVAEETVLGYHDWVLHQIEADA